MPNWTPKQKEVIDARDQNILVSAAAGSGKTAVLVERIINLLTDENNPVDIDNLLVVTFTKAAASEMKERVRNALDDIITNHPENEHIQKQINLINTAQITTIDSFCSFVVRENFEKIDLDPDYKIGDEGEIELLKADVLDEIITNRYEEAEHEFMKFIEQYKASKADDSVTNLIMELYTASESHVNPEKWVKSCIDNYIVSDEEDLNSKSWMVKNINDIKNIMPDICKKLENAINICEQPGGPENYTKVLTDMYGTCQLAMDKQSYRALKNSLGEYKIPRLPNKSGGENSEKAERVKAIKNEVGNKIKNIVDDYLSYDIDEILEEINVMKDQVRVIIDLTLEFMNRLKEVKQENSIMDFSDLEHYALNILTCENENGEIIPSDVAISMSKQYKEIMIDEYQDSNTVQEAILTSISNGFGINNVFMVGDVKQSIYRFRLANPNLFLEKYDTYSEETDASKRKIILDKNFRSRKEVIDSVNYIFDTIMCRHTGGIEYIDNNRLVCGASFKELPDIQDNATDIVLIEGDKEYEIEQIAKKIKKIVDPDFGMKVQDKDGNLRNAKYSDIVILLRGIKGISSQYVDVLEKYGIPAYTETKTGFYDAKEVLTVLNFLNVLDNPRQDIPLAGIMLSPMFNFSESELAQIRINDEESGLYDELKSYLYDGDDEKLIDKITNFMNLINNLRKEIPYITVYDLIDKILKINGYENYIMALPSGLRRIKNIEQLKEKAVAYENSSYTGLFNFIRYIEKVKVVREEGEALSVDESDNIVRIMSIHKSKGLQFPIVFLANATSKFRLEKDAIAIHEEYGIGMDYVNHEFKIKDSSLVKSVIRNAITKENKAELLRLLYVAMTRAQEKLIITGSVKEIAKEVEKINGYRRNPYLQATGSEITEINNFMDWILLATSRNKGADELLKHNDSFTEAQNEELYNIDASVNITAILGETEDDKLKEYIELNDDNTKKQELLQIDGKKTYDKITEEILNKNLNWEYPYYEDVNISAKASVTEIKRQALHEYDEQQDGMEIFKEDLPDIIPDFAKSDEQLHEKLTGANRGTAYHRIFELMDLNLPEYTVESVNEMINGYVNRGLIDKAGADCINENDVIAFSKTDLFERMKQAQSRGELFREQKFLLGKKACEVNPNTDSEELVVIQGIIDVCFIENGRYYVVDYKTDKVRKMEQLYDKYSVQLDYYKEAIEQITGKKVEDEIIYSVTLGDEISFTEHRQRRQ